MNVMAMFLKMCGGFIIFLDAFLLYAVIAAPGKNAWLGYPLAALLGWLGFSLYKKGRQRTIKKEKAVPGQERRCLVCGYEGRMKTWLRWYNSAQFIALVLLCFFFVPGLIFIAWGWGKYKCPHCGTLGKNVPLASTLPKKAENA